MNTKITLNSTTTKKWTKIQFFFSQKGTNDRLSNADSLISSTKSLNNSHLKKKIPNEASLAKKFKSEYRSGFGCATALINNATRKKKLSLKRLDIRAGSAGWDWQRRNINSAEWNAGNSPRLFFFSAFLLAVVFFFKSLVYFERIILKFQIFSITLTLIALCECVLASAVKFCFVKEQFQSAVLTSPAGILLNTFFLDFFSILKPTLTMPTFVL